MEMGTIRVEGDYERSWRWDGKRWRVQYAHRILWEKHNGLIPKGMVVHHKDGNKLNNVIDNLELMTRKEHAHIHGKLKDWNIGSRGKTLDDIMGVAKSAEIRAKRSMSLRGGKTTNPEQARKISEALKGRKKTPEHIQKIANAQRGHKWTDEQKAKLKNRPRREHSEETKRKMAESNLAWRARKKAEKEGKEAPDASFHYHN
jgi:hypothetical protein